MKNPPINIMEDIVKEELDVWIWLGDYAYVDQKVLKRKGTFLELLLHISMI